MPPPSFYPNTNNLQGKKYRAKNSNKSIKCNRGGGGSILTSLNSCIKRQSLGNNILHGKITVCL